MSLFRSNSSNKSISQQMMDAQQAAIQAQMDALMNYRPGMIYPVPFGMEPLLSQSIGVDGDVLTKLKVAEPRKVTARMPDLIQPIKAWRAWTVADTPAGTRLAALGHHGIWEPMKPMEAKCDRHPSPGKTCECGLWSFSSLDKLIEAVREYSRIKVLGEVALWGRVIECENGFRAQFGYPTELWLFDAELEHLGHTYNVPIRTP